MNFGKDAICGRAQRLLWPALLAALPACGSDDGATPAPESEAPDAASSAEQAGGDVDASCLYTNSFTSADECRQYTGAAWTQADAKEDCDSSGGSFYPETACSETATLGSCVLDEGSETETKLVFPGEEQSACGESERGCELFAGGSFAAGPTCMKASQETASMPAGIGTNGNVYTEGPLVCTEARDGEAGQSDGEVCTRSMIGGCTEPGRKFIDYATCEPVLTQRPYRPVPPAQAPASETDQRLEDAEYMGEVSWVKEQVESCGCVCCHSEALAPGGASNWDIDAGPLWIDSFRDTGLAMGAGWVSSESLGAFPAEDNNGFSREVTGLPTTDESRMIEFFENELQRRGLDQSDFEETLPFGGPIYAQSLFEPTGCEEGEGMTSEGILNWTGGGARYLFVMETGSKNPGAPPNLDLPEGTLWKLGVDSDQAPFESGVEYGTLTEASTQRFPATDQSPPRLTPGEEYYLYVQADVGIPITRCLFVAP